MSDIGTQYFLGNTEIIQSYVGDVPVLINPILDISSSSLFVILSGVTGSQADAVVQLYNDLESNGLLNEMVALYPFVGANSNAHSYNLINPLEYQLEFYGSMTHNSNGITGNGTNAYARTGFNATAYPNPTASFGLSLYNRTNNQTGYDIGSNTTGAVQRFLITKYTTGASSSFQDGTGFFTGSIGYSPTNSQGFYTAVSEGVGFRAIYQNAVEKVSRNNANVDPSAVNGANFYILANNFGENPTENTPIEYSNNNLALVAFHNYLDSTKVSDFYDIVQTYQTALSRQV